jgi:hypothetical protein
MVLYDPATLNLCVTLVSQFWRNEDHLHESDNSGIFHSGCMPRSCYSCGLFAIGG